MPEDKRQPDVAKPPMSARERHDADYITALAAFFVIALAEQEVFEEEAIRDFEDDAIAIAEGDEESPLKPLADWRYWRRWNSEDGSLKAFMHERIWPDLQRQYKPSDGPLGLLPELVNWSELDSNAVESAFVVATQFSNLAPIPLGHARDIFREQLSKNENPRIRDLADSFIVPPTLCELVLSLVEPQNGDKIYEPNVHRNGWLVELTERKHSFYFGEQDETAYQVLGRRLMERGPDELRNASLHGYSENRRELLISLVFLMFAGICKPVLHLGNPLKATDAREQFDIVLATPPIGQETEWKWDSKAKTSEGRYLEHIVERLKPGGRAFVVVPRGLLFREGREQKLREHLLKSFRVDAVIQLPPGILKPATSIPAALLIIRRVSPARYVWFITEHQFQQMVEFQMGLMEEDQLDLDLIRTVLRAKLKSARPAEAMQVELDRLAKRVSEAEESEAEEDSVEVTDTRQLFLKLGRFFLEEGAPGQFAGRAFKEFPYLLPVDELIRRKSELIWKESGEHTLHVLMERIQKAVPGVQITRLRDVSSGFAYRSEDMLDEKVLTPELRVSSPRLVRVGDLLKAGQDPQNRLQITPATRYLRKESLAKIPKHSLLRPGDILFSVTGTVGKVSVVTSSDRQLVAASGIAIIRVHDPILRQYLPALLLTEPYQKWFQGISAGSTVRHLTVRALEETPVPLFQGGVAPTALNFLTPGQSTESILQLIESKPSFSPWISFLLDDPTVQQLSERGFPAARSELSRDLLKQVAERIRELIERHPNPNPQMSDPFVDWLTGFQRLAHTLLETMELAVGPDRFSGLQSWRLFVRDREDKYSNSYREIQNRAHHASSEQGESPIRAALVRMDGLNDNMMALWHAETQAHLNDVRVTASANTVRISVGKPTEVTVSLKNEGLLPLRELKVHSFPNESASGRSILPPAAHHDWPVKLLAHEPGRFALNVFWKAKRLDDTAVSGETQLAFEAVSLRTAAGTPGDEVGENPYIYGRVLEGDFDRMFFGREKDMDFLESQLRRSGPTTVILLEGNRRIGKTSLLKHFLRHRLPEGWLSVFINFQDFDGHQPPAGERTLPGIPTRNIFIGMARELVTSARDAVSSLELPDLGVVPPKNSLLFRKFLDTKLPTWFNDDQPFTRFRGLLDLIREAVRPKRLLLLLDEFDRIQEGIASGITSDQVPENIRHVFQTYGDIGGIFTGSRTIRRLRQEYWNVLFGLGESHQLRGLDEKSALELVERPVAGRLVYSPAASRRIVELCARQPLLIQSICGRLFEVCKESSERTVTVEMVDKVAEEKAGDNEHFETLWGYIRSNRQRCLAFIVDELAEEQRVTLAFSAILDAAERHGVRFRGAGDLERDLEDLLDLEVLGAHGERRRQIYRIEVPLFSMWLKRTKDFEQYRRAAMEEL
jgi:type I restriction enzyme M protein